MDMIGSQERLDQREMADFSDDGMDTEDDALHVIQTQGHFLRDRESTPVWQRSYDESFLSYLDNRLQYQLTLLEVRRHMYGAIADEYPARWIPEDVIRRRRELVAQVFAKHMRQVSAAGSQATTQQEQHQSQRQSGGDSPTPVEEDMSFLHRRNPTDSVADLGRETIAEPSGRRRWVSVAHLIWGPNRVQGPVRRNASRVTTAARDHRPITRSMSRRSLRPRI